MSNALKSNKARKRLILAHMVTKEDIFGSLCSICRSRLERSGKADAQRHIKSLEHLWQRDSRNQTRTEDPKKERRSRRSAFEPSGSYFHCLVLVAQWNKATVLGKLFEFHANSGHFLCPRNQWNSKKEDQGDQLIYFHCKVLVTQ